MPQSPLPNDSKSNLLAKIAENTGETKPKVGDGDHNLLWKIAANTYATAVGGGTSGGVGATGATGVAGLDGATGEQGATGPVGATGVSPDVSSFVQKSGDTMTGKLVAAADLAASKLNIGNAIGTPGPTSVADGDLWISNQNKFAWRTNGNTVTAAGLSQTNTFSQPQAISSTSNAAPVATISNTGTREAAVFNAQGTSPAVRITQTGTG